MGDGAHEDRNQLARQDASVSTYNRRSPLGSLTLTIHLICIDQYYI
ncbi:hypothetical protein DICVIV_03091 [Dictyocaulus viviparus]|uniref:Uncharacterized protein n=1 Tax=Dictyocaulus viviparus TaxID=29172 RepID=A0A0D8Y237_DICVI|nr:hypothetical protein DICVIV_03091 [Dictyocaulus viviparus]